MPPSRRANIEQALGRAQLLLGDFAKAKIHFISAIEASEGISSESVYSALRYEKIPVKEFRKETQLLLESPELLNIGNTGIPVDT
jgi:hypothetical protein